MKPTDLKPPTRWEGRHVVIADRVWYVPDYYAHYDKFTFPGWQSDALFGNDNPVVVEYCSGNGTWIAAKAQQQPHINFVAVEKRFERVRKIWSKIKNHNLLNLIVVCGEACTTTTHYFPTQSIQEAYINFPDPWPKNRHAKHRLVHPAFLDQVQRVLKPEGAIHLATDDIVYSDSAIEQFDQHPGFTFGYPAPYYINDLPGFGGSFFEDLWRSQGREIRYHRFQKQV